MSTPSGKSSDFDFEKFRLRSFVDLLIEMDEVEVHEKPVALTALAEIIENTPKALLFKKVGPDQLELVAKANAGRARIAAAFETTYDKVYDEFQRRLATPQKVIEIPSGEAPVQAVTITGNNIDLTRLPFYPHHEFDGSCYISAAIDHVTDPQTGRRNVGSRRLSLRRLQHPRL